MRGLALLLGLSVGAAVQADQVHIVNAVATPLTNSQYRIEVTLQHADSGWEHYANQWQVYSPEGELLGTRTLWHPHENEQPFTRGLSLEIPSSLTTVEIRASDTVHGLSHERYTLKLR